LKRRCRLRSPTSRREELFHRDHRILLERADRTVDDGIEPVGGGPVAQELPHSRHARFRVLRFRKHFFQQGCLAVSKNV
jgi:hypothetical protein